MGKSEIDKKEKDEPNKESKKKKEANRSIEISDKKPLKEKFHLKLILISLIIGCFVFLPLSMVLYSYIANSGPQEVVEVNLRGTSVSWIKFETYTYGFGDGVSQEIIDKIKSGLQDVKYNDTPRYTYSEDDPDIIFTSSSANTVADTIPLFSTKMVLVGHHYWIKDSIVDEDLPDWDYVTLQDLEGSARLLLDTNVSKETDLKTVGTIEDLINLLSVSNTTVGLITPDLLNYQMKLLAFNNEYFLEDPSSGALTVDLIVQKNKEISETLINTIPNHIDLPNLEIIDPTPEEIFSFRMTGVTALSRNLAIKMENANDYTYPSRKLGEFLSEADLTHTSNEVSFVEGCVPEQSLRFCSAMGYIETLKDSGIDIVELTGNHNNDFGSDKNGNSIAMYKELGWTYFGGGLNSEDASMIKYIEKDGTKVALIGYNWYDSYLNTTAIAGADRPGANYYSLEKITADIQEAKEKADIVIVDFQFQECYSYPEHGGVYPLCYKPLAAPDQISVFRNAVDLGADIVVGTQAHQPQTFELYKGKPIFYGLGNLYFDQIVWLGTRQGLILTHYFVDGKHIQTKIDTTIYDGDMIPYLTYDEDRSLLLNLLDEARPQ